MVPLQTVNRKEIFTYQRTGRASNSEARPSLFWGDLLSASPKETQRVFLTFNRLAVSEFEVFRSASGGLHFLRTFSHYFKLKWTIGNLANLRGEKRMR
jgi:hypothetical protein